MREVKPYGRENDQHLLLVVFPDKKSVTFSGEVWNFHQYCGILDEHGKFELLHFVVSASNNDIINHWSLFMKYHNG